MSYEGVEEFLCKNGHYWTIDAGLDAYATDEERDHYRTCPSCCSKAKYHCRIDETNGTDEEIPETYAGPKIEIGWMDIPAEDHYGNKYFVKVPEYQPVLDPVMSGNGRHVVRWREI